MIESFFRSYEQLLIDYVFVRIMLMIGLILLFNKYILNRPLNALIQRIQTVSKKRLDAIVLIGVSILATGFGTTQLGYLGTELTFVSICLIGGIILAIGFALSKALPALKMEITFILFGFLFLLLRYLGLGDDVVNDFNLQNILLVGLTLIITLTGFKLVSWMIRLKGWDAIMQKYALQIPDRIAFPIIDIGTMAIAASFIMTQVSYAPLHLDIGFAYSLTNILGSIGLLILLMRKKLAANIALEIVYIGFGLYGMFA